MPPPLAPLPIDSAVPPLRAALAERGRAVLQAPPGAGKTTRVPLALLDEPWLRGGRIIMLEPRRIAARAAAGHMAALLGEKAGDTVGYRIRMDRRIGPDTRIEVVTEGILTRMLQDDPALEGVGAVIFDEFHERSLNADLGLALALETAALRDDLRLLVMSATLDGGPVARLLGDAPVVTSEGRAWPVETRHLPPRPGEPIEDAVARAVRDALAGETGSLLVFLPGAREIRRVQAKLAGLGDGVAVAPLYGDLPAAAQDQAIRPAPAGTRKVVLATNIAETSLTIEGVRVVIDSGLARAPRFDPRTGMSRLETVTIARAAADQRRGRAGRTEPGVCWRLWAKAGEGAMAPFDPPEILVADLAPLALELALWGVDGADLAWLDPPPAAALGQARALLADLGAIGPDGRPTAHGKAMARLPLHPRLAHMVLRARVEGVGGTAAELAAILEGRRPSPETDLRSSIELLHRDRGDPGVARLREAARDIARRFDLKGGGRAEDAGALLALAYPDRVARRRPGSRGSFLLANGRGAALRDSDPLAGADTLAVAETDDAGREARILAAAPLDEATLEAVLGDRIAWVETVAWDPAEQAVAARRQRRLGALVLADAALPTPDPAAVAAALLEGVRRLGLDALPWRDGAVALRRRTGFARAVEGEAWPDWSDAALTETLAEWLGPHLGGMRRRTDLDRLDLAQILSTALGWERQRALDALAPATIPIPSGRRAALDYADPAQPVLAVKLQEMFGQAETPRVGGGRVPVAIHLLSPAGRPLQVTRDLAGFWAGSYAEVRKDMRGRYPRHPWPDDPLAAPATARAKPRGT
ncbi:ATP-dependent helicase HrpB [Inquilinus limosus]|uniref:ATP-dependent helicase HrpB n=1 Tax=Inquilinus limosus TaxID=171674 RepID=A0A211ZEG9_9PROT|nr:ATP-dependent helicase HrpB [Inquilinus limosus]OWJ63645.1 ATP-dependent helicase HrpB [Inquilinus limosus]